MRLPQDEVHKILSSKGVVSLHHANSLLTSVSFLKQGALLSRGAVQRRQLPQTKQRSDDVDQRVEVWDDVFLDASDLHARFKRQNWYGPVTFVLDSEVLLDIDTGPVCVTRVNAEEFDGLSECERWF